MKNIEKKMIEVPTIEAVKFVERSNGTVKGYAVNTYHGLVKKFNEDRVSIIMNITKPHHKGRWPRCSYFGIFDGHGGNVCSDFLKENMHKYITQDEKFPEDPILALKGGFRRAEQQFLKFAQMRDPIERSGSCALVLLIIDEICYVANVGDSRAVLSSQMGQKAFPLTRDHKPQTPSQKQRIISAGGSVYQSIIKLKNGSTMPGPFRINPGKLSVSRSFGDIQAKAEKYEGNSKVLIAKPQITYFQINTNEHDFIFMGSDGIFDQLTNEQIVNVVWEQHSSSKEHSNFAGQASSKIIQKAMSNFSLDNLTSLLIVFEDNGRFELPKRMKRQKEEQNQGERVKLLNKKSCSLLQLNPDLNYENLKTQNFAKDRAMQKIEKNSQKRKSFAENKDNLTENTLKMMILTRKSTKNIKKDSLSKITNNQHKNKNIQKFRF